ncbi:hypothetical protein [Rossellomorea aquimaris]
MKKRLFLTSLLSTLGLGGLGFYITNRVMYLPKKTRNLFVPEKWRLFA